MNYYYYYYYYYHPGLLSLAQNAWLAFPLVLADAAGLLSTATMTIWMLTRHCRTVGTRSTPPPVHPLISRLAMSPTRAVASWVLPVLHSACDY